MPICLCVFVYRRGCGEGVSTRVLASVESRTTAHSTGAHLIPFAGRQHAPTQQALELSVKSSQPPKSCRFFPGSLCSHVCPSRPPNSVSLSLTVALNPKCSRRSLLGAIFLRFLVVSRLRQCCCCRRRRRCCRCRRLPRPRGLHYRVLQGGLGGRRWAWVSLCMDREDGGGGNCATLCSRNIQRDRTSRLRVRGCSAGAWRPLLLAGGGTRFGGWGGQTRLKCLWLPPPLRHQTAAGAQWALVPSHPPIRALVGENLILTSLWREKQACLNE